MLVLVLVRCWSACYHCFCLKRGCACCFGRGFEEAAHAFTRVRSYAMGARLHSLTRAQTQDLVVTIQGTVGDPITKRIHIKAHKPELGDVITSTFKVCVSGEHSAHQYPQPDADLLACCGTGGRR